MNGACVEVATPPPVVVPGQCVDAKFDCTNYPAPACLADGKTLAYVADAGCARAHVCGGGGSG